MSAGYKLKISVTVYSGYATGSFVPSPQLAVTPILDTAQPKRFASLFALYRKNRATAIMNF